MAKENKVSGAAMTEADWMRRARMEAERIWAYADLISDCEDAALIAFGRGENPETFAYELGEELELTSVDEWNYGVGTPVSSKTNDIDWPKDSRRL